MTMTTGEMLAALAAHGIFTPPFELRAEPVNGAAPRDYVGWLGIPLSGDQCLGVSWSFGEPSEDEMLSWMRVWHQVVGPMTRSELKELASA